MRKLWIFGTFAFICSIMFLSCGNKTQNNGNADSLAVDSDSIMSKTDTIALESQCSSKESKRAEVSVCLTLPVGDGVAQTIRETLLTLMGTQIYEDADYSGEGNVNGAPFKGDTKNLKAICDFYCNNIFRKVAKENEDEYASTLDYLKNDSTTTEEELKEWKENFRPYEQDITLSRDYEADNYIVFTDVTYGDRGGAHGGMGGYGYIIFNKQTGKQVKTIIKPGSAKKMQRLFKDGLKQYFKENNQPMSDKELMEELMLPDGSKIIPLPANNGITPTKDGLLFVYSQYEIACYADGMPSFVIPYDKVKAYMTTEALELLK